MKRHLTMSKSEILKRSLLSHHPFLGPVSSSVLRTVRNLGIDLDQFTFDKHVRRLIMLLSSCSEMGIIFIYF